MKAVRFLIPILIIPFLIGCQEEIPDREAQRLNLIGDGTGTKTFMIGCLEKVNMDYNSGAISQGDLDAAVNACKFNARGVANSVRQAGGARGFHGFWSSFSSWWTTGYWWPGYQENCEFDYNGYSCINYDYYYPWYYTPSSLGSYYNIDFSLFCTVASFSSLCPYFGYFGDYYTYNCEQCLYYTTAKKRRRCLRQRGCISDSVSTITWNEEFED